MTERGPTPENQTTVIVTQQQSQQQGGCGDAGGAIGCVVVFLIIFVVSSIYGTLIGENGIGLEILAWAVIVLAVLGFIRYVYVRYMTMTPEYYPPQEPETVSENYGPVDSENYGPVLPDSPEDAQAVPRPDVFEEIRRLAQLRDEGIITVEEFEAKKRDLLDRI